MHRLSKVPLCLSVKRRTDCERLPPLLGASPSPNGIRKTERAEIQAVGKLSQEGTKPASKWKFDNIVENRPTGRALGRPQRELAETTSCRKVLSRLDVRINRIEVTLSQKGQAEEAAHIVLWTRYSQDSKDRQLLSVSRPLGGGLRSLAFEPYPREAHVCVSSPTRSLLPQRPPLPVAGSRRLALSSCSVCRPLICAQLGQEFSDLPTNLISNTAKSLSLLFG